MKVSRSNHNIYKSSPTNVLTGREDLLRAFSIFFIYNFVFQLTSEKTLFSKDFTIYLRDIFMKIFVFLISTNLVTNSFLCFSCAVIEIKTNNQIYMKFVNC